MAEGNEPRPVSENVFFMQRDTGNKKDFSFTVSTSATNFRLCVVFQNEQVHPNMYFISFGTGTTPTTTVQKVLGTSTNVITSASLNGSTLSFSFTDVAYGGVTLLWFN